MLNPLSLAIVATTVIASARPSAAFVGSLASAVSTSATTARTCLLSAATRGGGRSQSLTMGSPPLGAGERVVIVGGGIGKKKGRGWKTRVLVGTAVQQYSSQCGSRPLNLLVPCPFESSCAMPVTSLLLFTAIKCGAI